MNCQRSLLITKNVAFYHHNSLVMKYLMTPSLVSPQWQGGTGYNNPIIPKNKSTVAFVPTEPDVGFVKRMMKRTGWFNTSKTKLRISGYHLYENVADRVDYTLFFEEFKLSDTFLSWFLVTELHVWMTLVRVMAEGKDGRFTRNIVVEAMWSDTTTRAKKLGPVNPAGVKEQIHDLGQQFNAALLSYDEGLLGDDMVLAGAIWRRFFQREVDSPQGIERLVSYIRQQVKLLDALTREEVLLNPNIKWISLPNLPETFYRGVN